ncbi:MAG TPA: hypothetical protein VGU64_21400, partial [Terriglobales bacterium]|nr:hypothetical protein [Terriglobales bacterium]
SLKSPTFLVQLRQAIEGEWYPIPSEVVIKTANPVGEAIVWYVFGYAEVSSDPKYRILCFVPSDGV